MNDQKSYPLYTVFENLLAIGTQEFIDSPAIWHVPDPLHLYQSASGEYSQNSLVSGFSETISSVSFSELNSIANQVAVTLSTDIRSSSAVGARELGNGPEQANAIVALFMPPGINRIIAQVHRCSSSTLTHSFAFSRFQLPLHGKLACMKLHLAYLPLDRQLSIGRILQILELITPIMVLVAKDYHDRMFSEATILPDSVAGLRKQREAFFVGKVETLRQAFRTINTVVWEDLLSRSREYVPLVGNGKVNGQPVSPTPLELGIPHSVCLFPDVSNPVVIVLFTSGSSTSGQKVVRLRQSQLYNRLRWQWSSGVEWDSQKQWIYRTSQPQLKKDEVSLASTACVFVDAFTELFSALFHGIPVVVPGGSICASEACVSDVRILAKLVDVFAITRITTVPVQLSIWINQLRLISSTDRARDFRSLRTVVVSGDILLPQLAHEFFQLFAEHPIRLLNFYGTTELAGDATAAVFHGKQDVSEATRHVDAKDQADSLLEGAPFVTVGRPISNTTIYIVRRRIDGEENRESGQRHDSGSLTMVVSENTDPTRTPNLSILGSGDGDQIDWEAEGYGICEKGCVGEIAVTGLAVFDNSLKLFDLSNSNSKTEESNAHHSRDSKESSLINFPGDLGFICPKDGLLYVCGRSDELVKINAVGFLAGDVDRLIDRMKQSCAQNPHQMSTAELKLPRIRQTVTIPIRHPVNKNKQLVCFYTTGESDSLPTNQTLNSYGIPRDLTQPIDLNVGADSEDGLVGVCGPSPIELSGILSNYLPVYIRPIFVHVSCAY
ncbi:unnamed protein product [Echinostoma caproni]|uniref:AMP-binding domain-containing protein n=1 Tax=Echinostoma caproni TaxID=27848 RepID=A0A183AQ03_9TREM|nr:unnamed protein product [Echinostoma caproni]